MQSSVASLLAICYGTEGYLNLFRCLLSGFDGGLDAGLSQRLLGWYEQMTTIRKCALCILRRIPDGTTKAN